MEYIILESENCMSEMYALHRQISINLLDDKLCYKIYYRKVNKTRCIELWVRFMNYLKKNSRRQLWTITWVIIGKPHLNHYWMSSWKLPFSQINEKNSKVNVTHKGVHLPISNLNSILAEANLLAHNNISQIYYCGQISSQNAAVN